MRYHCGERHRWYYGHVGGRVHGNQWSSSQSMEAVEAKIGFPAREWRYCTTVPHMRSLHVLDDVCQVPARVRQVSACRFSEVAKPVISQLC